MGDEAVQFGAETGAEGDVRDALHGRERNFERGTDFLGQRVKRPLGRCMLRGF